MIAWSRTRMLLVGLALIVFTNGAALFGVSYNRSVIEGALRLSERELRPPWSGPFEAENSGLALRLDWRTLPAESQIASGIFYEGRGGTPPWLDNAKLAELGFGVMNTETLTGESERFGDQSAREVLFVLEFDGPAYRQAIERARNSADAAEAARAAHPGQKEFESKAKLAQDFLDREERRTRLFAVDAGLDAMGLRAKYPDRAHYAIVRGEVRLIPYGRQKRLAGFINDLRIEKINVPYEFRPVLEPVLLGRRPGRPNDRAAPFEATIAFGKRFEPWMTAATIQPAPARRELGAKK